jgi:AraC-like DNA-binding protein
MVDLREILGGTATTALDRLCELATDTERAAYLDELLSVRAACARHVQRALVPEAIRLLRANGGQLSMPELSRSLASSERTLQRAFAEEVGMSAKMFARIVRFHALLERQAREPARSLTTLAFELGFSDQPHLNHDFRQLAGVSPRTFERELADSYKERARA